jgi:hypothetical protein
MNKRKLIIVGAILLVAFIFAGLAMACSNYFFTLPTNGIGYWTKQKESSVVVIANVTEHITCNNGLLHLEFDVTNTDGKVNGVELWVYFKDGTSNGGNILEQKYVLIGDMNAHATVHMSIDQLFTPASQLEQLAHEDFSIHYSRS